MIFLRPRWFLVRFSRVLGSQGPRTRPRGVKHGETSGCGAIFAPMAEATTHTAKAPSRSDICMLAPAWGVTWEWQDQFSRCLLHHHASFWGESQAHDLEGSGLDKGKKKVAEAWCKLQLLKKWQSVADGLFPLSKPFGQLLASCRDRYDAFVADAFAASCGTPKAGAGWQPEDDPQNLRRAHGECARNQRHPAVLHARLCQHACSQSSLLPPAHARW